MSNWKLKRYDLPDRSIEPFFTERGGRSNITPKKVEEFMLAPVQNLHGATRCGRKRSLQSSSKKNPARTGRGAYRALSRNQRWPKRKNNKIAKRIVSRRPLLITVATGSFVVTYIHSAAGWWIKCNRIRNGWDSRFANRDWRDPSRKKWSKWPFFNLYKFEETMPLSNHILHLRIWTHHPKLRRGPKLLVFQFLENRFQLQTIDQGIATQISPMSPRRQAPI